MQLQRYSKPDVPSLNGYKNNLAANIILSRFFNFRLILPISTAKKGLNLELKLGEEKVRVL